MGTLQDNYDIPPELSAKSLALVGISGLDTKNNAIHKSIWESFTCNRHVEQTTVTFKLIDNAHEFPVAKPKRNSYEWYIPKGILKRNWMNKHLNEIPSVVVIFYELDWKDSQWNEKMIECVSRIQSMRAALQDRNTRITIVLLQSTPPLPAGEDILATERASTLCSSCELNSKNLFILPIGDHLQGYVVRLENAFSELAQNYYSQEIKIIKSHREHLNKSAHQYLFVRHQFKMGFLSEIKQDGNTAYKHYTHAYNNLLEVRVVDTNAMEIRTIAGFINYKLCKLMFSLNLPRDAIQQFRAHTDRFKMRIGFQELAFEHCAWMSKQYSVFGDIFDEAVRLGLPAVQIQHPGIYYQQAAQLAIQRKRISEELCKNVTTYPNPDPLEGAAHMEFYGQRPWRPGKLTAEPPDPQTESNGILAVQCLEKQINISALIITLYGLAISQYKTYRCPRMRRQLVVQMADEYYNTKDYGKALTLLSHMLWDYRAECWWSLLSNILEKALKCAYLTANVQDYLILALEALGPKILLTADHKKLIYENLNRILNMQAPKQEPNITASNEIVAAKKLWLQHEKQTKLNISLDMGNIQSCIACKACFLKTTYQVDESVTAEIYLRNISTFPLIFSRLSVTVNTPTCSTEVVVNMGQEKNTLIKLTTDDVHRFIVNFQPNPDDIDKEIQIASVNINLGNSIDNIIDLKFTGLSINQSGIHEELEHFRKASKNVSEFNKIRTISNALIVPRQSKLSLNFIHQNPALLEEWYTIHINVCNNESFSVSSLRFDISLDDENSDTTEFSLKSSGPADKLPINFKLKKLSPGESTSVKLYLKAYKVGNRSVAFKVSFILDSDKPIASITSDTLQVDVVKPFEVTVKFLSSLLEDAKKFYVDEPFVVMPLINVISTWTIIIEDTKLIYDSNVENVEPNMKSQVANMELNTNEIAAEMFLANTKKASDQNINIGEYVIKWKRSKDGLSTITKSPLTGLKVDWIPLELKVSIPEHGYVRTPMLIQYHLKNRSHHLIQLEITMEGSEAFMFAGYKQISVLPNSTKTLKYNLYPLIAGGVSLPKLSLHIPENSIESPALRQEHLKLLVARSLPTHLFIMPQAKGACNILAKTLDETSTPVVGITN